LLVRSFELEERTRGKRKKQKKEEREVERKKKETSAITSLVISDDPHIENLQ
jgi:hypothetical protein